MQAAPGGFYFYSVDLY